MNHVTCFFSVSQTCLECKTCFSALLFVMFYLSYTRSLTSDVRSFTHTYLLMLVSVSIQINPRMSIQPHLMFPYMHMKHIERWTCPFCVLQNHRHLMTSSGWVLLQGGGGSTLTGARTSTTAASIVYEHPPFSVSLTFTLPHLATGISVSKLSRAPTAWAWAELVYFTQ